MKPRADFLKSMADLKKSFDQEKKNIATREAVFNKSLKNIAVLLKNGIDSTPLKSDHALQKSIRKVNQEIDSLVKTWLDHLKKHEANTSFRAGFGDALIVYVLGKVKAGKSSLGNYVAYGECNPNIQTIHGGIPNFFVQDPSDSSKIIEKIPAKFEVGQNETTSCIQGFTLDGLTWVDSPGLHSVTKKHGDLASTYAKCADLIIYPMNSGNPAREDDVKEISKLIKANTRFLAIITRCDKHEEDEGANGEIISQLVMKSESDRKDQIAWAKKQLKDAGFIGSPDVLTISVRYAEESTKTLHNLKLSGMATLFKELQKIAESEGLHLKQKTPSRNLNEFVKKVVDVSSAKENEKFSTHFLIHKITVLEKAIDAAKKDIEYRHQRVQSAVLAGISARVDTIVKDAVASGHSSIQKECKKALQDMIAEEMRKEELALLADNKRLYSLPDLNIPSITKIKGTSENKVLSAPEVIFSFFQKSEFFSSFQ